MKAIKTVAVGDARGRKRGGEGRGTLNNLEGDACQNFGNYPIKVTARGVNRPLKETQKVLAQKYLVVSVHLKITIAKNAPKNEPKLCSYQWNRNVQISISLNLQTD